MGASGDMLMAALYELLPDKGAFREKMERLNLPGVTIDYADSVKCGIKGTHITVKVGGAEEKSDDVYSHPHNHDHNDAHNHGHNDAHTHAHPHPHDHGQDQAHPHPNDHNHDHPHDHSQGGHHHGDKEDGRSFGFNETLDLIRRLDLPTGVIEDALGVYRIIGEAEAAVHKAPLDKIHLHEVGSLDAVVDVVGCSLLINMLCVTEIDASPVHVGSGFVRCDHGILPVPAPAAAEILKGIPIYGGHIKGELCTPTGAALLKRFVTRFGDMPEITAVKIGYGMGTKDFDIANCLRAFMCEGGAADSGAPAKVYEINCNLDDMTPEAIGAVFGLLFENGALDVYTTPITMKKNRPAVMLSCLCSEENRDTLARLMLRHTSTLGVRIAAYRREVLSRSNETLPTEYGDIRVKCAEGFGITKYKPEYDDVLAAAARCGVPFMAVHDAAAQAARGLKGR